MCLVPGPGSVHQVRSLRLVDKRPVSSLTTKPGLHHHPWAKILHMVVCLYESRCNRHTRRYWNWKTWKTWKLFFGIQCTHSSLNRTDISLITDAGHWWKWQPRQLNFRRRKESKKYQEIKILAQPHVEDQKLLSKRLFLNWASSRILEYLEILWSLLWDILGKGFVQT